MSTITAAAVKQLRDRTDLPMMDCKKALIEVGGDMEKAIDLLRSKFKAVAVKKSDRETAEGRIVTYHDNEKNIGAIVEVRCESAPVTKSEHFMKLCNDLAKHVAVENPASVEEMLEQGFTDDKSKKVNDMITDVVGLIRENMKVARFVRLEGVQGSYTHHDGTKGAALIVSGDVSDPQILRNICMHITATNPLAGSQEEIDPAIVQREKEVAIAQTKEDPKMAGKPDEIIEKSVMGKLNKWLAQSSLLDQPFVMDESKKVSDLLKESGLTYVNFVRYEVGEVKE